ncbi:MULTISPECIES: DUF4181 domain-containing protein [Cytobacillus]|uniref:DUF4181 domain-containing protein n=1 Tax=Cytobacillus stercorigallinarum TaxID=2762240 RepID=A0ABR8QSY8_9BACI|nr:DUF4181 domain-containing protein [Cytobacillus stercorigallinarum]MBD7938661.1 DUF4181 domain-containing protein [Cytobacillus stercorigallinarum]
MDIFVAIIVFIIIFFTIERGLNKLLGVKRVHLRDTEGSKAHTWSRFIIVILLFCFIPLMVQLDTLSLIWFWIIYLSLSIGSQAILEWKYIQSKQYVTTIALWIFGVGSLFWIRYYFGG